MSIIIQRRIRSRLGTVKALDCFNRVFECVYILYIITRAQMALSGLPRALCYICNLNSQNGPDDIYIMI